MRVKREQETKVKLFKHKKQHMKEEKKMVYTQLWPLGVITCGSVQRHKSIWKYIIINVYVYNFEKLCRSHIGISE